MSIDVGLLAGCFLLALAALVMGVLVPAALARDPGELQFLRLIFIAALVIRCGLAIVSYIHFPYGYFAPDEATTANAAADYLANVPGSPSAHGQGWTVFNILLFRIFGTEPLLPRLWNCVVGAITPLLGYALARALGAAGGARWSAILIAFFPSMVLWSTLNLHDVDAYLVILLAMLITIRLQESPRWWLVVAAALTLLAMFLVRKFSDVTVFVAVALGILAAQLRIPARLVRRIAIAAAAVVAGSVVVAVVFPSPGQYFYARLGLSQIARLRHDLASGARSAVDPDPGLQTLVGALKFLPHGLVDFLLRPFPWEGGSAFSLLTRPETVLYYILLPLVVLGIVLALRKAALRTVPSLVFLAVAGMGYALVLSNLGTIYRERGQLLVVMFAFVGIAVDAIVTRMRRQAGDVDSHDHQTHE
jgi:4-amino-4-deoxy-L-arabinose transferase-like glycosyltransferase